MDKPFDLKDLEAKLKAKGMTEVENLAEIVANCVFDWTNESLLAHPNPLVKAIGIPAVAILRPLAMGAIDKIDGQPG